MKVAATKDKLREKGLGCTGHDIRRNKCHTSHQAMDFEAEGFRTRNRLSKMAEKI